MRVHLHSVLERKKKKKISEKKKKNEVQFDMEHWFFPPWRERPGLIHIPPESPCLLIASYSVTLIPKSLKTNTEYLKRGCSMYKTSPTSGSDNLPLKKQFLTTMVQKIEVVQKKKSWEKKFELPLGKKRLPFSPEVQLWCSRGEPQIDGKVHNTYLTFWGA